MAFLAAWLGAMRPLLGGGGAVVEASTTPPAPPPAPLQPIDVIAAWAKRTMPPGLTRAGNPLVDGQGLLRGLRSRLDAASAPGHRPPVGGVYAHTVWLPVLGMQTISLTVLSHARMRLELSGAISLDDIVTYVSTPAGSLAFEFSAPTKRMLRRCRTSFRGAEYFRDGDRATFAISPPLVPGVMHVQLHRRQRSSFS